MIGDFFFGRVLTASVWMKSRAIMQNRIATGVPSLASNQHPDPDHDERNADTLSRARSGSTVPPMRRRISAMGCTEY